MPGTMCDTRTLAACSRAGAHRHAGLASMRASGGTSETQDVLEDRTWATLDKLGVSNAMAAVSLPTLNP